MRNPNSKPCNISYTLSLEHPGCKISEIQTVLISCSESHSRPASQSIEKLMPLAHLTVPAGLLARIATTQEGNAADCLQELLSTASGVSNLVVCLHTGCLLMRQVLGGEIFRADESVFHLETDSRSVTEGEILLLQETIRRELRAIQKQLRRAGFFSKRRIKLQGWVFEPELNWISFYDLDTGLLLPLSAHSEMCS